MSFYFQLEKEFLDLDITFHKAFDDTPDWKASMDVLIESGVNRILIPQDVKRMSLKACQH